jgi:hypothetical protein
MILQKFQGKTEMRKSFVAVAVLTLGIGMAVPSAPASAQTAAAPVQPIIPPAGQGQPGPARPMAGDMPERAGMAPMWRDGWHRHAMMWRHGMMRGKMAMTPRQRCEEKIARHAGVVAYTITKLNLTAQQKPLWNKVQTALQAAGEKQRQLCATLPSREAMRAQTVLDRMSRREQFLSAHLQALQQVRPAMQQFYQSLNADQQAILNHPFRRG